MPKKPLTGEEKLKNSVRCHKLFVNILGRRLVKAGVKIGELRKDVGQVLVGVLAGSGIKEDGGFGFGQVLRDIKAVGGSSQYELSSAFSKIVSALFTLSVNTLGDKNSEEIFEKSFEVFKKKCSFQSSKQDILKIVPSGVLEAEKLSLLSKKELEKANRELKRVGRMREDFINIAAHELKTPLIPIIGYLDMMLKDKKANFTSGQRRYLEICLRNAERERALVSDVLDAAKLDAGQTKFDIAELDPNKLLHAIFTDMKKHAEKRGNLIILKVPEKLPKILGDYRRITQVLINLIMNANKFTEDGTITIAAVKDAEDIAISVKDTGEGIEKRHLKNLFDKFYQVDTSIKREHDGTGLGLAICKGIVMAHGGQIGVNSTVGEGTIVTFTLPIRSKLTKGIRTISLEDYEELKVDLRKKGLRFIGELPQAVGVLTKEITVEGLEREGYVTLDYEELIRKIILSAQKLLGPMATAAANNIEGLSVSEGCKKVEITGDEVVVIQKLIQTYEPVVGPMSEVVLDKDIKRTLMREDLTLDYNELIRKLINYAEKLLGPMATAAANSIHGLIVKKNGEVEIVGDKIGILRDLVMGYERVVGPISEKIIDEKLRVMLFGKAGNRKADKVKKVKKNGKKKVKKDGKKDVKTKKEVK